MTARRIVFFVALLVCMPLWAEPLGLPSLQVPAENPQSPEKIVLGQLLFHDKRLSGDDTISCASCHKPERAFTDGLAVAKGIDGQSGTRNTPTLLNAAYFSLFFHDGRADSLEQQVLGPLLNALEHGLKDAQSVVDIVRRDKNYQTRFQKVFSVKPGQIRIEHITKAIASYERSLLNGNSAFDRYLFGTDRQAISASAARGLRIFRRKGNCANCHEISWNNALFMDNRFYNIGVGSKMIAPVLDDLIRAVRAGKTVDALSLSERQKSQLGRFNVTGQINDIGKFKTPSLRNIALTGPYMHDGSMATLEEVIEYYDRGGEKNPYLDAAIFPLHLTGQEKQDLVNFLKTLTGS